MGLRVGFGFDVHRLDEGQPFFLGGVKIPHSKGAVGHSDADVLIHTICDAILGAADLRDIGFHFPDTDGKYKGIDSKILLKDVMAIVRKEGYELSNVDATIALQVPKVNPYVPEMKSVLAHTMGVTPGQISIKATTTEKLSFVGREEGVSAYAVALIQRP
ncbi:MAG: 2-C-methyl-D-erythritol 2,4-cyclodiphosphate synthase [Bacteroidetes bacterium MED-G21]|nr:MAG: 2-C-methyl-D-erythritol 2,4-cyclodiphosphate synthase [Bacteroidetes bacterium MED-G21]